MKATAYKESHLACLRSQPKHNVIKVSIHWVTCVKYTFCIYLRRCKELHKRMWHARIIVLNDFACQQIVTKISKQTRTIQTVLEARIMHDIFEYPPGTYLLNMTVDLGTCCRPYFKVIAIMSMFHCACMRGRHQFQCLRVHMYCCISIKENHR